MKRKRVGKICDGVWSRDMATERVREKKVGGGGDEDVEIDGGSEAGGQEEE